jgi:heme-degrading monooxygenase HmoA
MSVKVLINRVFKNGAIRDANKLLMESRSRATLQSGFISGETLISAGDPNQFLVISTWTSKKRWDDWYESSERKNLSLKLDDYLQTAEEVQVFLSGERAAQWVDMA